MRNIGDEFLSSFGIHSDSQFFLDNTMRILTTTIKQDFKEQALVEKKKEVILDVEDLKNEVEILREDIQNGNRDHATLVQLREASKALFKKKCVLKEIKKEEGAECENDIEGYAYFLRKKFIDIPSYFKKIVRLWNQA